MTELKGVSTSLAPLVFMDIGRVGKLLYGGSDSHRPPVLSVCVDSSPYIICVCETLELLLVVYVDACLFVSNFGVDMPKSRTCSVVYSQLDA